MTLADLLRQQGAQKYFGHDGTLDELAVWKELCRLVAEQAGVKESDIRAEMCYVADLQLG